MPRLRALNPKVASSGLHPGHEAASPRRARVFGPGLLSAESRAQWLHPVSCYLTRMITRRFALMNRCSGCLGVWGRPRLRPRLPDGGEEGSSSGFAERRVCV